MFVYVGSLRLSSAPNLGDGGERIESNGEAQALADISAERMRKHCNELFLRIMATCVCFKVIFYIEMICVVLVSRTLRLGFCVECVLRRLLARFTFWLSICLEVQS